uniref:Uncharacterized protein n=1 Tax=Anopheles culicifacies TaxID=139723 RepID=A0A182LXC3_9DIPT
MFERASIIRTFINAAYHHASFSCWPQLRIDYGRFETSTPIVATFDSTSSRGVSQRCSGNVNNHSTMYPNGNNLLLHSRHNTPTVRVRIPPSPSSSAAEMKVKPNRNSIHGTLSNNSSSYVSCDTPMTGTNEGGRMYNAKRRNDND